MNPISLARHRDVPRGTSRCAAQNSTRACNGGSDKSVTESGNSFARASYGRSVPRGTFDPTYRPREPLAPSAAPQLLQSADTSEVESLGLRHRDSIHSQPWHNQRRCSRSGGSLLTGRQLIWTRSSCSGLGADTTENRAIVRVHTRCRQGLFGAKSRACQDLLGRLYFQSVTASDLLALTGSGAHGSAWAVGSVLRTERLLLASGPKQREWAFAPNSAH
jgi:hypothetical protein